MIQIRNGVFETNSSSTHSICIPKKTSIKRDSIYFGIGEYGWENIPRREAREFGILPDSNGNLLIAQKSHAEAKIDRRLPVEYAHVMAEMMEKYFPGLCCGRVLRAWICPTPFPDDGNPYFGFVKAHPNLFCAAGLTSALLPGPAAGELMAKILTGETCPYDLTPYDPMRGMKK